MLEVLEDFSFKKLNNIQHGFFTRFGGASTGIYSSLNCAYPSNDNLENVQENRRLAMAYFGKPLESLISVRNIHSNKAVIIEQPWQEHQKPEADAMVTNMDKIILGSDSADCPIVLLADDKTGVIGLAHAGWRGAKNGIIKETIEKMVFLGAKACDISATISPCIAQSSYEINLDFYKEFLKEDESNHRYFNSSVKENHFLFDLLDYVKNRLIQCKIKSVSTEVSFDTYTDERFFSCRRATHKGEPWFGGHLSCIYKE